MTKPGWAIAVTAIILHGCVVESTTPAAVPARALAPVQAAPPPVIADAGAPPPDAQIDAVAQMPDLFGCAADADCVAAAKVGCCQNGEKVAVRANAADAYARSFTCPDPHPVCPMYLVQDLRIAECNAGTRACEMVKIEEVRCGGAGKDRHVCPEPYKCGAPKPGAEGGSCTK